MRPALLPRFQAIRHLQGRGAFFFVLRPPRSGNFRRPPSLAGYYLGWGGDVYKTWLLIADVVGLIDSVQCLDMMVLWACRCLWLCYCKVLMGKSSTGRDHEVPSQQTILLQAEKLALGII